MEYEVHLDKLEISERYKTKAGAIKFARKVFKDIPNYKEIEDYIYLDKWEWESYVDGELLMVSYQLVSKVGQFALSNPISMNT